MGGAASEGLRYPRPTDGSTEVFGVVEELMGGLSPPHKAMWCGKKGARVMFKTLRHAISVIAVYTKLLCSRKAMPKFCITIGREKVIQSITL